MATKTRVVLDLNTRVKVIHASEQDKLSVKQIMKMFNIGKTQVYEILKKKTEILMRWENCGNGKIKRELKKTANEDVNEIVWEWFVSVRAKNHRVSGPMVQEYAKQVAQKLGKTEFKASNGWLESFRKRHQIVFNELCGESSDVNSETIEEWVAKLPFIIQGYGPENIANGDETGLFFRALPNKSLCLKGEKCSGGKLCKERLTVFLCGFISGEMEKPLVIGKAAKPRCFRNLDIRKLPVEWRSNKKAWMTSQIMEEWLTAFNGRMKMQNRHVLLFLDNAACHPHIKLSNVRLAWFPPNTTCVSQPMDQGIIRNVKVHYRKLLMQSLLANMDCTSSASELARTVSVLDAVIWISQAVKKLLPETVTRCFEKAGFFTGEVSSSVENENDQQDLQNCMNEAAFSNCNAEDYINIDKDVQTEPDTMDIDALVQNFRESQKIREEEVEEEEDENDIVLEEKCSLKTYQDAVKSLKELQEFAVQQNDSDMLGVISQAKVFVESQVAKRLNCVQKTLLDYWKK
jgi:hypothetical protein